MSMQGRIGRAGGIKVKRALGVQAILEWAFRVEKAQLELPLPKDVSEDGFGFGMEYVLLQRGALGCKVDGGQHKMGSYTHADAEVVAATLAGMPDSLGGKRMAIYVAELARAGMTPDWLPGAVPRCVPVETKTNQHGERASTIVVGTEPSCLDYGDTVCPSRGMCVDKNAACFDSNQCNYEGFTCKSNVTECVDAHDALLKKHNQLVDDFNENSEIAKKMATQLEDIQTCLNYASTLEAAKLCAP